MIGWFDITSASPYCCTGKRTIETWIKEKGLRVSRVRGKRLIKREWLDQFLEDHEDDNEYAVGAALNNIPYVIPAVDYTYSTEADGGFLEVSLRSELPFFEERLIFEPYVMQAFDFGFATDEHDGRNNVQVGIGASLSLTDHVDLVGSLSHSWAQTDVDRENLGDLSWGAIGLAATF